MQIVDLATLTGACIVALGNDIGGNALNQILDPPFKSHALGMFSLSIIFLTREACYNTICSVHFTCDSRLEAVGSMVHVISSCYVDL